MTKRRPIIAAILLIVIPLSGGGVQAEQSEEGPAIAPPHNGAGSGWDQGENRVGQEFILVSPATLTRVCLFMQAESGSATFRAAHNAGGLPPTEYFLEGTVAAGTLDGWSCADVHVWVNGGTLLVYYESGPGKIGYRETTFGQGGGSYASYNGGNWKRQPEYDRGFGISIEAPDARTFYGRPLIHPQWDGVGSGWDSGANRVGQRFSTLPGELRAVCLYLQAESGTVTYRVTDGEGHGSPQHWLHEGTVAAGSVDGWACDPVSLDWTSPTIQIYYERGPGKVGYRQVAHGDGNAWASYQGASWQRQPDYDRGFGFTLI